uniref:(northern house mosquito) hypothetical protein n=1 Tax=Culex pipiens TaxID=7175 RepID=A0A8D8D9E5_CULPI
MLAAVGFIDFFVSMAATPYQLSPVTGWRSSTRNPSSMTAQKMRSSPASNHLDSRSFCIATELPNDDDPFRVTTGGEGDPGGPFSTDPGLEFVRHLPNEMFKLFRRIIVPMTLTFSSVFFTLKRSRKKTALNRTDPLNI